MMQKDKISEICLAALNENQFIVDISVNNANDVFVYIDDFNGLTIEECQRISRFIESNFDREVEDYSLEVGSPGLSKPFKVDKQYQKALNTEVEIVAVDGEKIVGTLTAFDNDTVEVTKTVIKKINNKKQEVKEIHKIDRINIKSTKSEISISKKNK